MSQFKRFNVSENGSWDSNAAYPEGTLTWTPGSGLRLHDGSTSGGVAVGGGGGSLTAVDDNIEVKVSDASQNYYNIRQIIDDNNGNNYASTELSYEQFSIRTDQQNNGGYEWRFDSNGEFRIPGNINTYDNDIEIRAMNAGNAGNITIKTVSHINNIHYSQIQLTQNGINITTDMDVTSGGKSFEFRDTGILALPAGGDIVDSTGASVLGGFSGDYDDLTNKPTLFDGDYDSLTDKPTYKITVASGTGPGGNNQADSLALAGLNPVTDIPSTWGGDLILQGGVGGANGDLYGEVRIKSGTIGANYEWHFTADKKIKLPAGGDIVNSTGTSVLFSGSYNDLTDKPTLFDGDYDSLTDKPTLFTANQSLDTTSTVTFDTVNATNITVNGQPTTYGYVNGAYLLAQNTSDQSVGQNIAVNFQTTSASNGSIITKTSNTQVTLTAGNTYKLEAIVRRLESSSTWAQFRWYDVTNSAYIGTEGFSEVVSGTGAVGSTNVTTAYVTPSVNTTYELRQTTNNTITVSQNFATIEITQVNPTIAVQATATGTVSKNYAKYTRTASQSVSVNSVIVCNVLENTSGTAVSVNTSTGQATLMAGTYRLRGTIGTMASPNADSRVGYGWYNETTSAWIGEGAGWSSPGASNYNTTTSGTAEAVITVASTAVVSLRVTGATNIGSIGGNQSDFGGTYANPWIDIEQMGSTFALNALDTMTTTGNVTVGGILSSPQQTKASNATGTVGQICWDENYIYVCIATNTWKRTALTGGY